MTASNLTTVYSIQKEPDFKDGDDGDITLASFSVNVVDNGYILSTILDTEEGIDMCEVYTNTDDLLARIKELIKK